MMVFETMTDIFSNPLQHGYPLSYKCHTYTCLILGTLLAFTPTLILTNPLWIHLHPIFGLHYSPPLPRGYMIDGTMAKLEVQQWANVGILITAIGVINMVAASKPGRGAFARETPKIRLVAAALTAVVWVVKPESRDMVKALVMVEDGIGGLVTGWQMGLWL